MLDKCYVIPVQKTCNANCTVCISKSRNYNKAFEVLEVNDKFCENLQLLARRGIKNFEITGGGEPFLNDRLDTIIRLIKYFVNDAYVKVYTNGNILKNIGNVDELDISVFHYDDAINNKIMRVGNPVPLLEKLEFFRGNNPDMKIRLSIALHKDATNSKEELDKMIEKTSKYVDEYVVRTLYPGCNDYNEKFVDFDYQDNRVVFERDNNVDEFDSILLWSDGNMYTNWNLDKRRFLYSYILLKPDASLYINEINREIEKYSLKVNGVLFVQEFISLVSQVYESYNRGSEYETLIYNHLHNLVSLFGNNVLVYLLDGEGTMESIIKRTLELKKSIRDKYSFTHSEGGYVLKGENLSHVNLVHCPDSIKEFNNDINILAQGTRKLEQEEMGKVLKYRSFYV